MHQYLPTTKYINTLIISTVILILSIPSTYAEMALTQHHILSQDEGLSSHKINAICKDKFGTIWIGTQKGLDRIFENKIVNYNENSAFRNTEIVFIAEDSTQQIWVATRHKLYLYNFDNAEFEIVKFSEKSVTATSFCLTKKGILFSTSMGILNYNYHTRQIAMVQPRINEQHFFFDITSANDSTAIVRDRQNKVALLNLKTNTLDELQALKQYANAKQFLLDSKGQLWITFHNNGVLCYSLKEKKVLKHFTTQNSNLSHNTILTILEHQDKIWVSTDGKGINIIDPSDGSIKHLNDQYPPSLKSKINTVNTIYYDSIEDNLWLGTIRRGVICVHKSDISNFSPYTTSNYERVRTVLSLFEDSDKQIWIGMDGGGLSRYDTQTGVSTFISSCKEQKITAITEIDKENLLIAIYNKGIYKFNKRHQQLQKIDLDNNDIQKQMLTNDVVVHFANFSKAFKYILADKVYLYDVESNKIKRLHELNIKRANGMNAIYVDSNITILQNYYEIFLVDNHNFTSSLIYQSHYGDIISARKFKDKLIINQNNSLHEYDLNTKKTKIINLPNNNYILTHEIDSNGNLWCASYNSLIQTTPDNYASYTVYKNSEGWVNNELFPNLSIVSTSGDIYMGGNTGVNIIHHKINHHKNTNSPISLLAVKVDGTKQNSTSPDTKGAFIKLPWNYHSIEFIISNGKNVFKENTYKYIIADGKKDVVIQSDNTLSLPTLSHGKYILKASTLQQNGKWSNPESLATILITPPWWQNTLMNILLFVVLFAVALYAIYLYHLRKRKQTKLHFEMKNAKLAENKINFLINLSHELRTPLTLIFAPVKRLLSSHELDEDAKYELNRIHTQSKYMIRLINMVLDIRVIEQGYGQINIKTHNIYEWIKGIGDEFILEYDSKNIELAYDLDPAITSLNYDADKLYTALSNLLMNAYKYSHSNTTVTIKTQLLNDTVRISVIDQGIGIKHKDAKKLFDRFIIEKNQTKGWGIGLSYTKQLVELHKGATINVIANDNIGSTFYIDIPVGLECNSQIKIQEDELINNQIFSSEKIDISDIKDLAACDTSTLNLLIVEDEPEMQLFIKEIFEKLFNEVYIASDGIEALEICNTLTIDLIISDVMMPRMNGFDFCKMVKNDDAKSHIPIILLTTQANSDSRLLGYQCGADIFFPKPFDELGLKTVVFSLLKNRRRFNIVKSEPEELDIINIDNPSDLFMEKLNSYINENISNEDLSIEQIVDHMCMSRAAFYKKLKSITKNGAMEYVAKRRLSIAQNLLERTDLPISTIALEVGYTNTQRFSRVFKQHFHKSPSEYRKSLVKSEA